MILPSTGAYSFGDIENRIQRLAGGQYSILNAGTTLARIELAGTSAPQTYSVITREKGDLRFAAASSAEYKDNIKPAPGRIAKFLGLNPTTFWWGGSLPEDDERRGKKGYGLIWEDVKEVLPEAARELEGGTKVLDPLALIAALFAEVKSLTARLDAMESA